MVKHNIMPYTGGIIDGEGCIGIHKGGKHNSGTIKYRMRVIVGNTNKKLITFLYYNFGGFISTRKVTGNNKPQYAWELAANKALFFLKKICPYLLLKKRQAELCIKFQTNRPMRKLTEQENLKNEEIILELKKLNKVGVEVKND